MRMVLALLPILSIIGSMALMNLGTMQACALGLILAVTLGTSTFGLPITLVFPYIIHGVLSSWDLVLVIIGGSLMGTLLTVNGTTEALFSAFAEETREISVKDQTLLNSKKSSTGILLIGVCLGVIPAVSAMIGPGAYFVGIPMLLSLGILPEKAISVFLLSQSWGLANFTFGLPCIAMSASTGISASEITSWSAIPMLLSIIVTAFMLRMLLGELKKVPIIQFGVVMSAAMIGCTLGSLLGPAFPTVFGGILGTAASVALQKDRSAFRKLKAVPIRGVLPVLLVAIHLGLMRIPKVKMTIGALAWFVSTPVGSVKIDIISSSGMALLMASLIGFLDLGRDQVKKCLETILRSWAAMMIAPLAMSLANIMTAAGMVTEIVSASAFLGKEAFIPCLPLIGMLGHYLTGSLLSGSLVVGTYIADVAPVLNLPSALAASVALVGGAPAVAVIPSKIAIASAVAGYTGSQRNIVRIGLLAILISWVSISVGVWLLVL